LGKIKDKVILVVSFGTTYEETRKLTIESIENRIGKSFPNYEIRRAFTSHVIIKVLQKRNEIIVDTPEEALLKIKNQGYREVIVQSLHIMPGEEYEYVSKVVESYKDDFKKITLGRPILYFKGDGQKLADDYSIAAEALRSQIPKDSAAVFMGHGTSHPANACYSCLQLVFRDKRINNVYIGTVEGYPTAQNVINTLNREEVSDVTLMPFMIVAGNHCSIDMASDEEDSWKQMFLKQGFKVHIFMHGIGENTMIQDIFVQHVRDAITGKFNNIGKTKKGI
jgi:sirohydrochlorin cobaltochelatase